MKTKTVDLPVYSAPREIKDPASNLEDYADLKTYEVIIKASNLPDGLPLDPNPRDPKPKGKTYVEIIDSLKSNDGLFHKKNKGITMVVGGTEYKSDNKVLKLHFRKGDDPKSSDGILDGGHTYSIIRGHATEDHTNQYVKATIMSGVPPELIPDLSAGLNNSTALNDASKMHHSNKFDWIKDSISGQSYENEIVYFQNDVGTVLVEDLVAIMTAMNVELYPIKGKAHPIIAYSSKSACLKKFNDHEDSYLKFKTILPDVLRLHDQMSFTLREVYNNETNGKAGALGIFNSTKVPKRGLRRMHKFHFIGAENKHRLEKAVAMPLMAALRTQLDVKKVGGVEQYVWIDGYEAVLELLEENAMELFDDILNAYSDIKNINQLGKSNTLWNALLKTMRLL